MAAGTREPPDSYPNLSATGQWRLGELPNKLPDKQSQQQREQKKTTERGGGSAPSPEAARRAVSAASCSPCVKIEERVVCVVALPSVGRGRAVMLLGCQGPGGHPWHGCVSAHVAGRAAVDIVGGWGVGRPAVPMRGAVNRRVLFARTPPAAAVRTPQHTTIPRTQWRPSEKNRITWNKKSKIMPLVGGYKYIARNSAISRLSNFRMIEPRSARTERDAFTSPSIGDSILLYISDYAGCEKT